MQKTLKEVAELIDAELVGDPTIVIKGISGIKEAQEGELTFVANSKYLSLIETTKASAIITSMEVESASKPILRTKNPDLAFTKMIKIMIPDGEAKKPKGIHPTAVIGENVKINDRVAIQAYVVIEDNVEIGEGTILYAGVFVGHNTKIGKDCLIYPHVTIREKIVIGDKVIIHSGAVIGGDGFGFSKVKNLHVKIPQIGTVIIDDDVEIGANVTIDRARFGKTHIGKGTKIDNLVQIAHNVVIGENTIIVAQTGISGSTSIGKGVIIAGQAGIVGHINIGDNAIIAAKSGVSKSIPDDVCVFGSPAKPIMQMKKIYAYQQRLPKLFKAVANITKKLGLK